jgi:hypothetical protein
LARIFLIWASMVRLRLHSGCSHNMFISLFFHDAGSRVLGFLEREVNPFLCTKR